MDIHSGYDYPNPYGLQASDFDYDMDSYVVALRFLSDLTGGTEEQHALETNGANTPMLRNWESSAKFRRVLSKCRAAGASERVFIEQREAAAKAAESTEPVKGSRLILLAEVPVRPRASLFSSTPNPVTFGDGSLNLPG